MSANHPRKRQKESGFCSRVSMMATGRGVRSCVPPRSASTGSGGCGTGVACVCHSSGDGIRVRLRAICISSERTALELFLEPGKGCFGLPLFAGALVGGEELRAVRRRLLLGCTIRGARGPRAEHAFCRGPQTLSRQETV